MFASASAASAANQANDDDFSDSPMELVGGKATPPKDKKRAPRKPKYDTKASHAMTRADAVDAFGLATYQPPAEYLKVFDASLAARAEKDVFLTVTTTFVREAEEAEEAEEEQQPKLTHFEINFAFDERLHGPFRSPADLPCDDDGQPVDGPAFVSVECFVDALCALLAPLGVDREQFVRFFAVVDSSGDLSVNQITKKDVARRNVLIRPLMHCCLCGDVIPMGERRQAALTAKATINGHALHCCEACPVSFRELTVAGAKAATKLRFERSKKTLQVSAAGAILYADFDLSQQSQPNEQQQPNELPKLPKTVVVKTVVVNLDDETSAEEDDSDSKPIGKPRASPIVKSERLEHLEHAPKLRPAPKQAAAAAKPAPKQQPAAAPKPAEHVTVLPEPLREPAEQPQPAEPQKAQKRKPDQSVDLSVTEHRPQKAPRTDGLANAIAELLAVLAGVPDSVRASAIAAVAQNWPKQ
jgi:hypothetical protein